jgi:hypothetical protein
LFDAQDYLKNAFNVQERETLKRWHIGEVIPDAGNAEES